MAIPTPPDCDAMAMPPGRNVRLVNVALRPQDGRDDTEAVGPDDPHAVPAGGGKHFVLQARSSGPEFGEPCGDDHGGRHTEGAALLDDRHDGFGGNGDDGEVGHRVELIEPTNRVDPTDRGGRRMDHADLALERLQQVSENRAFRRTSRRGRRR